MVKESNLKSEDETNRASEEAQEKEADKSSVAANVDKVGMGIPLGSSNNKGGRDGKSRVLDLDAFQDQFCAKLSQNKPDAPSQSSAPSRVSNKEGGPDRDSKTTSEPTSAEFSGELSPASNMIRVQVCLDHPLDGGIVPGAHPVEGAWPRPASTAPSSTGLEINTASIESCIIAHLDVETPCDNPVESVCYEGRIVEDPSRQRRRGWLFIACAGLVGIAVVLCLALQVGGRKQPEKAVVGTPKIPTSAPTEAPFAEIILKPFTDDLPSLAFESIEHDINGPFYKANLWLLKDPRLDSYSLLRKKQRFFLAMLFYATSGESWTKSDNWLSYNVSECEWFFSSSYTPDSPYYEPRICDSNGTVINLSVANNNVSGHLPIWYTSFLPYLRVLDLGNNTIGGQMPVITTSPYLEVWVTSNTQLGGKPILNTGVFVNLKSFEWENGMLELGSTGAFHYMVPNLEHYNINGLHGNRGFYSSIGLLTNLRFLAWGHSESIGTIPSELGLLTDLMHLDLSYLSHVNGTIPSELGLLTKLTMLDLLETPLTGSVPARLCNQVDGGRLDIQANCSLLECCF